MERILLAHAHLIAVRFLLEFQRREMEPARFFSTGEGTEPSGKCWPLKKVGNNCWLWIIPAGSQYTCVASFPAEPFRSRAVWWPLWRGRSALTKKIAAPTAASGWKTDESNENQNPLRIKTEKGKTHFWHWLILSQWQRVEDVNSMWSGTNRNLGHGKPIVENDENSNKNYH